MAARGRDKPPITAPLPFQHPSLVTTPPDGPEWIHEIKFDGYRMQIAVVAGRATITTRNGLDWTERFPIMEVFAGELDDCVLDGEMVAIGGNGQPDFSALRSALARRQTDALVYYAFDCLASDGEDLRPLPLSERKARLRLILDAAGEHVEDAIRYVEPLPGPARGLLRAACELQLEGIVSKRLDAPYVGDRTESWRKAKCRPGHAVIIGGWRQDGHRFTGLLCGLPDSQGGLRYIGSVSTGFSGRVLEEVLSALREHETSASPFTAGEAPKRLPEIHWAHPTLVADVEVAEFTASGKMRQPSFKGLRFDKTPDEVAAAEPPTRNQV